MSVCAQTKLVTGAQYVRDITALDSDRRAREAFQRLALRYAMPGARIFDFGCGPGIDARFYAEQGRLVTAYDVDEEMCRYFATYCQPCIEKGQVVLQTGSSREFVSGQTGDACVSLITANFAPLNLIGSLPQLFERFAALAAPSGHVLASVLNPYLLVDLRYRWWWLNLPRLWREGHYAVEGAQAPIVRRTPANFDRQCIPHFRLVRIFRGAVEDSEGTDWNAGKRWSWLRATACRFLFLLFEKTT